MAQYRVERIGQHVGNRAARRCVVDGHEVVWNRSFLVGDDCGQGVAENYADTPVDDPVDDRYENSAVNEIRDRDGKAINALNHLKRSESPTRAVRRP